MEILNTIDGGTDYILLGIGVLIALFGFLVICAGISASEVAGILVGIIFVGAGLFGAYASIDSSPDKVEAIVTDYNEVYERGYEVVEQRGDITVLQKRESEAE
ncbi:hypothetical protein DOE78_18995 [Bacillus sp. Y1]|nr:hypothetical protein [Bacillus sp. Y1]AYA77368.1 hypothetical protein DOE78_18995 [Bacillus sp. Y1]